MAYFLENQHRNPRVNISLKNSTDGEGTRVRIEAHEPEELKCKFYTNKTLTDPWACLGFSTLKKDFVTCNAYIENIEELRTVYNEIGKALLEWEENLKMAKSLEKDSEELSTI